MGSYLFARPSFLLGLASLADFGNTLTEYNYSIDGAQADYLALRADWYAVGADLWSAMEALQKEAPEGNGAQVETEESAATRQ